MMEYDNGYEDGYEAALKMVLIMIEGDVPLLLLRDSIEEELDQE